MRQRDCPVLAYAYAWQSDLNHCADNLHTYAKGNSKRKEREKKMNTTTLNKLSFNYLENEKFTITLL